MKVVGTPGKVLMPVILPRVKERNHPGCGRIRSVSLVVFGAVTSLTGQSKVVFGAFASVALRHDMFDGMQLSGTEFRADAVLAIADCIAPDQPPQAGWYAFFSHAEQA